jgi:hypothetical protein
LGCSPRQQLRTEKQIQDTLRGGGKLPKDTERDTEREGKEEEEEEEGGVKRKRGEETRDERFSGGGLEQRRR